MKKVLALMAVVAMVAISSVAYAQTTSVIDASINASTVLTPCDLNLGSLDANDYSSASCNTVYYTSNTNGVTLDFAGTANGLYNSSATYSWDKIAGTDDWIDATCDGSGACTEEWGFNLDNAGAYSVGTGDNSATYDQQTCGNGVAPGTTGTDPCYHAMPTTATTVVSSSGPITDGSNFDLAVAASTDGDTASGAYTETVTLSSTDL